MLVVISDLHFTDGTTGKSFDPSIIRMLKNRLGDMAYDASWSKEGDENRVYKPIEEFDIVLLGDVVDLIRSTAWTDKDDKSYSASFPEGESPNRPFPTFKNPGLIRPWSEQTSDDFITMVDYITERIIEKNEYSFKVFRDLAGLLEGSRGITLPPAENGKPKKNVSYDLNDPEREGVEVKIHYLVGNHDWFYYLKDKDGSTRYNDIREKIKNALGLANTSNPFPHDIWDEPDYPQATPIRDICKDHSLFVRHGDKFDPFNYIEAEGRGAASIGDILVVELFNLFPREVEKIPNLNKYAKEDLREVGNVSPTTMAPVWVDGVLKHYSVPPDHVKEVKKAWDKLAKHITVDSYYKEQDKKLIKLLSLGLRFTEYVSFRFLSKLVMGIGKKSSKGESYAEHAIQDAMDYSDLKYFVYGHTHFYEYVPIDILSDGKKNYEQIYINSGTWHNMHMQTHANPKEEEFVTNNVLTFLAFYKDGERLGREYEVWNAIVDV